MFHLIGTLNTFFVNDENAIKLTYSHRAVPREYLIHRAPCSQGFGEHDTIPEIRREKCFQILKPLKKFPLFGVVPSAWSVVTNTKDRMANVHFSQSIFVKQITKVELQLVFKYSFQIHDIF